MNRLAIPYEIRTRTNPHCTSLIFFAEFPSDIVAIFEAHKFTREDEGVEVWREDTIVYRLEPRTATKSKWFVWRRQQAPVLGSKKFSRYFAVVLRRRLSQAGPRRHGATAVVNATEAA